MTLQIFVLIFVIILMYYVYNHLKLRDIKGENMTTLSEIMKQIKHEEKRKKKLKKKGKKNKYRRKLRNISDLKLEYEKLLAQFNDSKTRLDNKVNNILLLSNNMIENKDKEYDSIDNTRNLLKNFKTVMHNYRILS